MREDIRTIIYPLPSNINSYVVRLNGYYTIVLNDELSTAGRIKAYNHEMEHIINGDLNSSEKADYIELWAHKDENEKKNI